jgi:beta-aspartyl-peptidase (threonine type)
LARLIVHGGAGTFAGGRFDAARASVKSACNAGEALLGRGAPALDVVEMVVALLEDDPIFDAGHGSYPNAAGEVEMDAILVDGATLRFGAVAAIRNVANPVRVARRVMDETPHCLLVGAGATNFAREQGFAFVPDAELASTSSGPSTNTGTVGAVALDNAGRIAAATSTGGIKVKIPGRVGDSPLIGCGAIAEDGIGGVSATGEGEKLMQVMMSRTVLDFLKSGLDAQAACDAAVRELSARVNGHGGVICVDAHGNVGHAFNTPHMAWAAT